MLTLLIVLGLRVGVLPTHQERASRSRRMRYNGTIKKIGFLPLSLNMSTGLYIQSCKEEARITRYDISNNDGFKSSYT